MKSIVIILAVGAIVAQAQLTDEQKQKIIANGKTCVAETGVNPDLIKAARQGKFTEDDKLKAFTFCMSKKIGFQNAAGEIQTEVIKQKLGAALNNPEATNLLLQKCLVPKATSEETAFHTFKCYHENTPTKITVF